MTPVLLDEKILRLTRSLARRRIPHAFGGAIAVAYYGVPRGTEDIDLNLFLPPSQAPRCIAAVAALGVEESPGSERDWQHDWRWEHTPIHVFFSTDPFHDRCRERTRSVPFAGQTIPILSAEDLAIFKSIYARAKDHADLREMLVIQGESFDADYARLWLEKIVGPRDERLREFDAALRDLGPALESRRA